MSGKTKTWIETGRRVLERNVLLVKSLLGGKAQLMAVVKSNAYGHGLQEVVPIFDKLGIEFFGVDSLEEAEAARKKTKKPILILGYTPLPRLKRLQGKDLHQTVYSEEALKMLSGLGGSARIPLHLKIETGTARQGVPLEELPAFLRFWKRLPNLELAGISTHFADVEDVGFVKGKPDMSPFARTQLERFRKALEIVKLLGFAPRWRHMASSAATLFFPETHFDAVRPGISLYGLWPSLQARRVGEQMGTKLEPALSWKTVIVQIKALAEGESVGYDRAEVVRRRTRIAVLPIGYWDGYPRALSHRGEVLIGGRRAKVLGRVCMNMIMADATDIPEAREGSVAVLVGRQGDQEITVEELAEKIGTINYEVVTRINPLIPRIIV